MMQCIIWASFSIRFLYLCKHYFFNFKTFWFLARIFRSKIFKRFFKFFILIVLRFTVLRKWHTQKSGKQLVRLTIDSKLESRPSFFDSLIPIALEFLKFYHNFSKSNRFL